LPTALTHRVDHPYATLGFLRGGPGQVRPGTLSSDKGAYDSSLVLGSALAVRVKRPAPRIALHSAARKTPTGLKRSGACKVI